MAATVALLLSACSITLDTLSGAFAAIGIAFNLLACIFLQRGNGGTVWASLCMLITVLGVLTTFLTPTSGAEFEPLLLASAYSNGIMVLYFSTLGVARARARSPKTGEGAASGATPLWKGLHRNWWAVGSLFLSAVIAAACYLTDPQTRWVYLTVPFFMLGIGTLGYGVILGLWQEIYERDSISDGSLDADIPST